MDFTESEIKLFHSFDSQWNAKTLQLMSPIPLYNLLAIDCFRLNTSGPNVEALRRAIQAIHGCKIYRQTKEFDNLIQF